MTRNAPIDRAPKISVVMPVMNEERYVRYSIESILSQTFSDFEFIIIDDGSTDGTPEILADYARRDGRIRIIRNNRNMGISRSLNIGIKAARGDYIARMDGDDVNTPDRFEKQAALLDENSDLVVAGAGYQTITADGRPRHAVTEGVERWECDWFSIFRSTILHSIMMYRRETLLQHNVFYDPAFDYAEDVEFAHRLLRHGAALCLSQVMLVRRFHPANTSSRNLQRQRDAARRAATINAHHRFPEIPETEIETLFGFLKPPIGAPATHFHAVIRAMEKTETAFARSHNLDARQRRKMRNHSARWLFAAALNRHGARKAFYALGLVIAGWRYLPNVATEAAGYLQRRLEARPDTVRSLKTTELRCAGATP